MNRQIRDTVRRINNQLIKASRLYYQGKRSPLTDEEFDTLREQLEGIVRSHPEFSQEASALKQVGAAPERKRIRHLVPMLSLANVFGEADFTKWTSSAATENGTPPGGPWLCEPKLDGVSLSLLYENDVLVSGATRGDGIEGEDISHLLSVITGVPMNARFREDVIECPGRVLVRGEVVIRRSDFTTLNTTRARRGLEPFRNPRNTAAGALRLLDPKEAGGRMLHFIAFDVVDPTTGRSILNLQSLSKRVLESSGFEAPAPQRLCSTHQEVASAAQALFSARDSLDVDLDGMVIKVDDTRAQRALGSKSRTPNWAVAWKWKEESALTELTDVSWQVGRTGRVTPRGTVRPVMISGAEIQHVTLHNPDFVKELDLHIGDTVQIVRSGEVIPKVTGVVAEARDGSEVRVAVPNYCPGCDGPVTRRVNSGGDTGVDLICTNHRCPTQLERSLVHFASRKAMDLDGWGPKAIQAVIGSGLVRSIGDLYRLQATALEQLDGFGVTKAAALISSLRASKTAPLHRVLIGLGIPTIGSRASRRLTRTFTSMKALREASVEALSTIEGIGSVSATLLHDGLKDKADLLDELEALGLQMAEPVKDELDGSGPLEGLSFVITGTLSAPRNAIKVKIESAGGRVSGSISGNTHALIAGEGGGSKRKKAQEKGIPIWSEADLLKAIEAS